MSFILGTVFLLSEKRWSGITALILAIVLMAGGGVLVDHAERKAEKVPTATDSHGNTYYTWVITITNHYKDTYYSIPSQQTAKGTKQGGK